jgi:membrane protein DedA with SNARE-associated domain
MDFNLIDLMKEYGYIILFFWSIIEGETGLIMAGLFVHTGDMVLAWAIITAGVGAFVGDQIYFYLGRFKKKYVIKKLSKQKSKIAYVKFLLRKYGWFIVFIQRYLYGLRTIIPLCVGLMNYSPKTFAIINFISALFWSSIIIIPVWYFGDKILSLIAIAKEHWYLAIPVLIIVVVTIVLVVKYKQRKLNIQKLR